MLNRIAARSSRLSCNRCLVIDVLGGRGFNRAEPAGGAPAAAEAEGRADSPMRPFHLPGMPPYIALILSNKENMIKRLMREPLARKPEPRTHGRVEVEGPDEVTSQRYLALAALKAPQSLPQHDLSIPRQFQSTRIHPAHTVRANSSLNGVFGCPDSRGSRLPSLPRFGHPA